MPSKKSHDKMKPKVVDDSDRDDNANRPSIDNKSQKLAIQYLKDWKKNQNNSSKIWKFNKMIQVYILRNIYDPQKFKKKYFKIAINYVKGLKGQSRNTTLKQAKELYVQQKTMLKVIASNPNDAQASPNESSSTMPSVTDPTRIKKMKKRAKKMMQTLA